MRQGLRRNDQSTHSMPKTDVRGKAHLTYEQEVDGQQLLVLICCLRAFLTMRTSINNGLPPVRRSSGSTVSVILLVLE